MNITTTEAQALALVYELNDKTLDHGHTGPLRFESSGFISAVTLFGETVWDTEEYEATYIDDGHTQMPLRQYFMERIASIKEQIAADMEGLLRTSTASPDGAPSAAPATQP